MASELSTMPRDNRAGSYREESSWRLTDVLWLIGCFLLSACLAWQGWRGVTPWDDDVPGILAARKLLATGQLPSYGDVNNYHSLSTPGPAWLSVPGVLLFSDFRQVELGSASLLHAGIL